MLPNPETCRYISIQDVQSFDGVIVDVRTPEAFEEAHIPGTKNHCVYQVDFLEKFPEAFPDKSTKILIYGDGNPYKADLAALGRLQYLGYTDVFILEGGLSKWLEDSREVSGSGSAGVSDEPTVKRFELNPEQTKVRWIGRNLMNQHDGEIAATDGFVEISENGELNAGKVTVDMRKMVSLDIEDNNLAAMLIGHLASADFFDVENHPLASFEINSAEPISSSTYGMPNYSVKGVLSAKGRSLELEIEAVFEPVDGGFVFQTVFNFDRTQLGVLYGSGRIFERLGMHLVNDLVTLDVAAFFTKIK